MVNLKNSFMQLMSFLMNLIFLNLLWILFSFLGLVLFGLAPATVCLFHFLDLLRLEKTIPSFKEFFIEYKKNFFSANRNGVLFLIFTLLSLLNFKFSLTFFSQAVWLQGVYLALVFIFLVSEVLILANQAKIHLTFIENIRLILVEIFRFPVRVLAIIFTIFVVTLILSSHLFIFLTFGIALALYLVNFIHSDMLNEVDKLKNKLQS
ncbi:DUF624 domain-containing protein [Enterococcus timonensis]|uniref:DUF624 domain-containing protein n=1 Tax=Enterococcus timonensis TaxID=1852364 RepID=UPI0008DAEA15|nr:DUF624 domain-containing protein [Enterococcus timonensis]